MKYVVELPKILCLTLIISKFAKEEKYYNTNDLIRIANKIKPELVRLRKDKNDYKYFDDTNFGGLRGNFSTLLTLKGFVKKNNRYVPFYGIGKNDRLFNAFRKGEIILDSQKYYAYTNNIELKKLLEAEAHYLSIREKQAHIKTFLNKNPDFPLVRDTDNFPKVSVLKSYNNKYFLRILFNTYIKKDVIEYNLLNYLSGSKVKQFNMHALFVVPSNDNCWEKFYVIDSKEILEKGPLFLYFDVKNNKIYDKNNNVYPFMDLEKAIEYISDQNGNVEERLLYDWNLLKSKLVENIEVKRTKIEDDEFSIFLEKFLCWKKSFIIYNKTVTKIKVSSSGGPDVILEYSGGTTQTLELEHKWNNYILHQHYKSLAWKDTWLYADEEFDFEKLKQIFEPYLLENFENVPKVFLCTNKSTGEKEAYEVDWNKFTYVKLCIKE